MYRFWQALKSLNIVMLIGITVTALMGALLFFVTHSHNTTQTLNHVMEKNQSVTQKMQLYGQLMEYARSRTRLSSSIILEEDVFIQDEINMQLEVYANKYARARAELLALPLRDQERAILEKQNTLVSKILPAQRQAVALAMSGDATSRQKAQTLLDTITYPGQGKLIDGFLQLMEMETQRQRKIVEQGRLEHEAEARRIDWITNLVLSLGLVISMFVIYRVYLNQQEVNDTRQHLETIVEEKTHDLQLSEERHNRSQEIAHVGTWDWDIKQGVVYWSDETFRMFGLAPQQFTPSIDDFLKYIHKKDIDNVNQAVEFALQNPEAVYHVEHRIIRASGEERVVEETGEIVRDENGVPVRMIGVVHDITERMQAERMKNEFVSTISHELRTPLTAIQGSLKLLLGNALGELNERIRSMIELANNNCDRLLHLVNDLLDMQKIESGKMEFHFDDTSVQEFMSEVINAGKPYADAHDIKLILNKIDETTICADKMRMMQVMNNLISNAVKFSDAGNKVEVSATLNHENNVVFAIKDYGRGIPEEFRDKLFNRFTQVDSSDRREKLGTGLGLAISRYIIEEHQGQIWYESELECGTTFYVELEAVA